MSDLPLIDMPIEMLEYWIGIAPGAFCAGDLSRDIEVQQLLIDKLERLVEKGVLNRHGSRRGWYIPRKTELVEMDFKNANDTPLDVWLPFGLSDLVELYENSVVIVAGAPNAGKTALMLNIIHENMLKEWDVHYFNSEMAGGELRKRLQKFPHTPMDKWNFHAYERAEDFHDVVFPGPNQINIIDFLEIHDEFYVIGRKIKEIHDRLKGAVAIICLQKNPGSKTGLGGFRSMEVCRLALAIDKGRVEISKAKNFRDPKNNPNGKIKNFKLFDGCQIIDRHGWYREEAQI